MIVKNQYPICEFDTNKNPIIHPTGFLTKKLPKKCVITYLRRELERFVEENYGIYKDHVYVVYKDEEKLEGLEGGRAFHIRDGSILMD